MGDLTYKTIGCILGVLVLGIGSTLQAQEWDVSGNISSEYRYFPDDPISPFQVQNNQISLAFEPEFQWQSQDRSTRFVFTPFLQTDSDDPERSYGDVREAYWEKVFGDTELLVGVDRVFWGVTESRHLVNVINQVDFVRNIDDEDFLGQPMVKLARQTNVGRFELFYLPYFRERSFPGRHGRLRFPIVVDDGQSTFESRQAENRNDFALRYSHYIGDLDIGLHAFHGTNREPLLRLDQTNNVLAPHYSIINQLGVDLQLTKGAWLWKLEGILREGQGDTFSAVVAGFEHTLYQVYDTDMDVGLLAEVLYDDRPNDVFPTLFDNDLFLGARLAANDVQDSSALIGIVTDWQDNTVSLRFEAERRIGQSYKIELEAQFFSNVDSRNPAAFFEQDGFIQLSFSRFF